MHPRAHPVNMRRSPEHEDTLLVENNDIYDNIEYNFKMDEGQSMDIHVAGNWWGGSKKDTIEASLYDKRKNNTLGRIFYMPYKTEPIEHIGIR